MSTSVNLTPRERLASRQEALETGGAPRPKAMSPVVALLVSMRPGQWPKNVFMVAPLFFSKNFFDPALVLATAIGFAILCLVSSSVYLFNDALDVEKDREHKTKRNRPIAAGYLSVNAALGWAGLFAIGGAIFSYLLDPLFLNVVGAYLALNLAYTMKLKHVVIVDVMCIAGGFVLRVIGGSIVAGVVPSHWLILCTLTLAAFLGFSKRRQELILSGETSTDQRSVLKSYSVPFLDQMISIATSCTVMSYALYTVAPETVERFDTTNLVYTLPFVLFGVFRYFHLTYHQVGDDNPSKIVLRDQGLLLNGLAFMLAVGFIIY